ncbi:MAG: hypothetical protein HC858_11025 [Brachymonas sp.]|nr:hypothetical protein [Brachymonas sp.]
MLIAVSAEATEQYTEEQVFGFVSDVSGFEGQFYSVYDYCSPYAGKLVAASALNAWKNTNNQLLADRDRIVANLAQGAVLSEDDATNLKRIVEGFVNKARNRDSLYKDLINEPDKFFACAKRFGEMNSSLMNFKNIAPASYEFWKKYVAP